MTYTIILQALLALLLVIALACLVLFFLKKMKYTLPLNKKKLWQIKEIYYLDASNKIIEVSKENYLYTLLVGKNNNIILNKHEKLDDAS